VDVRVLTGPQELRKSVIQSVLQWHFATDAAQSTRVVHIAFDLAAAKNRKEEGPEFVAYAPAGFAIRGSVAEEEARKRAENVVVVEPGRRYVVTEGEEAELRRQKELKRAEAERALQAKIESNSQVELDRQQKIEIEKARKAADTEGKLVDLQLARKLELEKMLAEKVRFSSANVDGSVVKSIRVFGISDQAAQDLMSKLPIREGETLTRQLMESVTAAIHRFDEHLEHQWLPGPDNTVEVRIVAPGFRGEIRRKP
jgi:hypothetical protein